ncbi:MAG: malto-oligosyltrehalose trehalohydrolase [Pirellulales bacterium]
MRISDREVRWQVWAPRASRMHLHLDPGSAGERLIEMRRDEWGTWRADVPDVRPQARYAFSLHTDGPLRPDPASVFQPDGVHRPSALFFPNEYQWHDNGWKGVPREDLVFYELHVGTFTPEGTFDAIIPRLKSLRELGITALEILPVCQFPGSRNWGYDGAHLFAAQNSYGGPAGLQRLVDAAHQEGMAVVLDLVLNHFGPEGNYVGEYGPYYSTRYTTPWGPAFNFDGPACDAVRYFVLENIWQWIAEFHLDGLRLDAVHAMYDTSPEHILSEIKLCADAAAASRGATAVIVAESLLNDVRMVQARDRGGYGLDAEWNEDFHHALVAYLTGERHGKYIDFGTAGQLTEVLQKTFYLAGSYSRFRGRRWGAPARGLSGDHFTIGTQNHDHVGNRACGERLSTLVTPPTTRLCASLMLLAPYLPLIFMGEEYAEPNPFLFFCSFEDQGLIANVREGRARDYQLEGPIPDPQAESSFAASKLTWQWTDSAVRAGLRRLYSELLRARRVLPPLRDFQHRSARLLPDAEHAVILELVRGGSQAHSDGSLTCYFNLTDKPQSLPIESSASERLLLRTECERFGAHDLPLGLAQNVLKPFECIVWGSAAMQELLGEMNC